MTQKLIVGLLMTVVGIALILLAGRLNYRAENTADLFKRLDMESTAFALPVLGGPLFILGMVIVFA